MTPTEGERLSRQLTDMRVEAASEFATIRTQLKVLPDLLTRVHVLELAGASHEAGSGKFTWGDVAKFLTAVAALISAAYIVTHW